MSAGVNRACFITEIAESAAVVSWRSGSQDIMKICHHISCRRKTGLLSCCSY